MKTICLGTDLSMHTGACGRAQNATAQVLTIPNPPDMANREYRGCIVMMIIIGFKMPSLHDSDHLNSLFSFTAARWH